MRRALLICVAAFVATTAGAQQTTALQFGSVVDGGGRVIKNGVVLVRGDTIIGVLDAKGRIPSGVQVVDLRRYTAIPGMIDAHTHITYAYDPASGADPWRQPQ